jgi:nucleotide-binding universal stress UspA family protein
VVDARALHREEPLPSPLSILLPVNGTDVSRRAAEVGIVLARASKAPLTALYVTPGGQKSARAYEEAILKDIVQLADTYELTIRTAVRSNVAADDAILKEMARGRHNLVVMGVGRRPGDKLFFGDTAAALLEKSTIKGDGDSGGGAGGSGNGDGTDSTGAAGNNRADNNGSAAHNSSSTAADSSSSTVHNSTARKRRT